MKFLVILISLAINYLWLKDFDRFDDSWFFRLRRLIEATFFRLEIRAKISWLMPVASIYALMLLSLLHPTTFRSAIGHACEELESVAKCLSASIKA